MSILSIAPLFALLLLFLAGITLAIVLAAVSRRQRNRITRASCGKCLYAVEGLSGMTCPECGSDLRAVGIIAPRDRSRAAVWPWIAVWSMLLPLPAFIISTLVYLTVITSYDNSRTVRLTAAPDAPLHAAVIDLRGRRSRQQNHYDQASIQLATDAGPVDDLLLIDLDTNHWTRSTSADDDAAFNAQPVTAADITRWLAEALDVDDDAAAAAIGAALLQHTTDAAALRPIALGEHFSTVTISSVVVQQQRRWFATAALAFWLMAWLLGIALLVRRRQRLRAKAANPSTTRIIDVAAT